LQLILASNSPRRTEILRHAGFRFKVRATYIDESLLARESPRAHVLRLAREKTRAAAERLKRGRSAAIVIGADTVVVARGKILGKPRNAAGAHRMLRLLIGRTHEVLTGVCLRRVSDGEELHHVESTRVHFLKLSHTDIKDYIATREPFDKAGAYGIQGVAGRFIDRIEGCYFNVVGLPLSRVSSMLRELGFKNDSSRRV
jgi:nucleoside triphosphate pyrophosphatase